MSMSAAVEVFYGVSLDSGWEFEDEIKQAYIEAKRENCIERGIEPDDEGDDDVEERDDFEYEELIVEGITFEFIMATEDVGRGFGVRLFYHDWNRDAERFSRVIATVKDEMAKVGPIADKVFAKMGIDPELIDIYVQTAYS